MGRQRQTRQTRRAQERRTGQRKAQGRQGQGPNWSVVAAGGVVAIAVILLIVAVFRGGNPSASGTATPTANPTLPAGPIIAGIPCDTGGMNPGFHVHTYLAIYFHGKPWNFDGTDIGHDYSKDCLFEMHAHPQDTGNVIHIETAHPIYPTLAQWFTIMRATLTKGNHPLGQGAHAVPNISPPGVKREVWVDGKLYTGDPMKIKLIQPRDVSSSGTQTKHEQIVIEVGAPFFKPKPYKFPNGL